MNVKHPIGEATLPSVHFGIFHSEINFSSKHLLFHNLYIYKLLFIFERIKMKDCMFIQSFYLDSIVFTWRGQCSGILLMQTHICLYMFEFDFAYVTLSLYNSM